MSNHATDTAGVKARDTALQGALTQIERQFGKGTVMRMGDEGAQVKVNAIPTGALSLDLALGIGGMPRGRIVEVFGPESSGKTTLVYHVLAEAQKLGGVCAFIDAEHAMDPLYAQQIGVDIDELLVSQPDYGEQALEIADMLVRSGAVDIVAVDSVAALTPRAELEGQMGDQTVGLQARMMSQAMRKLAGNLNRTQTLCLFVNQIREKVGVMFGSPETQPGGRALKFYSSQRLDIRRIETLKDGTEAVGNRVRVKVVKNKVAAPFRQAEFDIEFGKGISSSGCILDLGIEHNIVAKSGSFFSYDGERLGQGRNNAKGFLDEHQEIAKEIEAKVYEALGIGQDLVTPIDRDKDAPVASTTTRRVRRWPSRPPSGRWRAGSGPPRPRRTDSRRIRVTRRRSLRGGRRERCGAGRARGRPRRARPRARVAVAEQARPHGRRGRRHAARQARRAGGRRPGGDRADRARLPRRRPLRRALRRGPPAPRRLGLRSDRPPAAGARASTSESIEAAVAAQDPEEELAAARELLRRRCPTPPTTRAERDRALGILDPPRLRARARVRRPAAPLRGRAGARLLTAPAQVCADRPAVLRSGEATDRARGP